MRLYYYINSIHSINKSVAVIINIIKVDILDFVLCADIFSVIISVHLNIPIP